MISTVLDERRLPSLRGGLAIAHCRYSTTGSTIWENAQPTYRLGPRRALAIGHNGNLVNTRELLGQLERRPCATAGVDGHGAADRPARRRAGRGHRRGARGPAPRPRRVQPGHPRRAPGHRRARSRTASGRWSWAGCPAGARRADRRRACGRRRRGAGWCLSSETAGLDIVGAEYVRDVEPGEIVILEPGQAPRSVRYAEATPALCVFELIYFARPDSYMEGRNLYEARRRMGEQLALEHPVDADLVMPVPDTGAPAAAGYAEASGLPYREGMYRNRYAGRTFIQPSAGPAPPRRDDQAQPAPRGRHRQAADRRRRFDRARHDDQADRRAAAQGRGDARSTSGSAPRRSTTRASTASTRRSRPSSSPRPTRSPRSASSSARTRSATCRSAACSPRSTCRTSGSASPASTATTRSPCRTTRRAASSCSRSRSSRGCRDRARPRSAPIARPASTSPPASGPSSSCAPTSSRRAGRRSSAAWAGSAARSRIPAGYREPLLIASTDGVGTKTAIAAAVGRFDTIGIDLVAMCADDVVCCGAEPLAFLDYVAVGRLDPDGVAELVGGVAAGCRDAGCGLVGGETAEHPGLMEADEFDLAGCCIGVVERSRVIDGSAVRAGDAIVGLARPGCTSNGFSLVRSLIAQWDLDLAEPYQARLRRSLGDAADRAAAGRRPERGDGDARRGPADADPDLCPGRARARGRRSVRRARHPGPRPHHRRRPARQRAAGAAGRPRRAARPGALAMPSVMRLFGRSAGWTTTELRATFNGGLGMVVVVPAAAVAAAIGAARRPRHRGDGRRRGGRRGRPTAARYVEGALESVAERERRGCAIAVGVSGAGSNLRALARQPTWRARRRDRPRLRRSRVRGPGLGRRAGDRHRARPRWRRRDAGRRPSRAPRPTSSSWPATCGSSGRPSSPRSPGQILNTHPSLLPAFPGAHAVHDALAHGARVTGCTVHLVDETLDGGPIVAQEAVAILPGDDDATPPRPHPGRRAPAAAARRRACSSRGGVGRPDGRRVTIDLDAGRRRAAGATPGAAVRLGQDRARDFARGLVAPGFELVSTGGTARALRDAGLPVTDVAA